jgi:Domain of unknown function (DUF1844)
MSLNTMADEKKIIIDEDWKSQVQAEKEKAAKARPAASASSTGPAPDDTADFPLPPASFDLLLTMLATEALVALGQVPHPATGQPHIQRSQAQYLIDLIDVLRTKTKGNLNPDEEQLIESILHQLRLAFVESANQPASPADAQSK